MHVYACRATLCNDVQYFLSGLIASNNSNRSINKYSRYHSLFDKPPTAKFWDGSLEEVSSSAMKSENCNVSNNDVSSRNSSLTDASSPFRTLNRKNLRDAVRAVKGKFRNSHSNRKTKIEVVRPSSVSFILYIEI